eukprot:810387-Heterocapsa_arctica.AAC.1
MAGSMKPGGVEDGWFEDPRRHAGGERPEHPHRYARPRFEGARVSAGQLRHLHLAHERAEQRA